MPLGWLGFLPHYPNLKDHSDMPLVILEPVKLTVLIITHASDVPAVHEA